MSEISNYLNQWSKVDKLEPQKEGEVTAREYGEMIGLTRNRAKDILTAHVVAGTWKSRITLVGGKRCEVFWPLQSPDER